VQLSVVFLTSVISVVVAESFQTPLFLTLRRPMLPCGYGYKASWARPG